MSNSARIDFPSMSSPRAWSRQRVVERDRLEGHVLLFDAVRLAVEVGEPLGQVARRELVGEARRVVERAEVGEFGGRTPGLFEQLAPRCVLEILARDVELSGRDLEHLPIERPPVLAEHEHRPVVIDRDHTHRAEMADEVPFEGVARRIEERPGDEADERSVVPFALAEEAESAFLVRRRHRDRCRTGAGCDSAPGRRRRRPTRERAGAGGPAGS